MNKEILFALNIQFLRKYLKMSAKTQQVVRDMLNILAEPTSEKQDKDMAIETLKAYLGV